MNRLKKRWKSYLFVLVQFLCLGVVGLSGAPFPRSASLLAVELAGLALGVWAVLTMRIGNFNITPDPPGWIRLVASGPYRFIRHPMYLALLLTTLPLAIDRWSMVQFVIWTSLLISLILKMAYEERLLVEQVEGYERYRRESFRLIPFIC